MFEITDYEIEYAEQLLLAKGEVFDTQRRDVIRCMDSKDIQACPGSGKTTALLAKLTILAQKLPFQNNKGLCVLTHTNVAADEIRQRLGGKADILFQYPNHFGTIQSFVNKFLAIPAYIDMYGKRPARIDNDIYHEYIERYHRRLHYGTKKYIERKMISLPNLRFNLNDFNIISKEIDGPAFVGVTTETYRNIRNFKFRILSEGILCYDDAYSLAYWYLNKHPNIKEVISERYGYVFIDEMQDTDKKQEGLLDKIFDFEKVTVQKIGDSNQAIYNSSSEIAWKVVQDHLSINDSKRFSQVIAERVKSICLIPQELSGNTSIPNIAPKIVVFNDDTIAQVIPTFGDLIYDNSLYECNKKVYKAIGGVGQPNTRRTLPSYFESYGKLGSNRREDFDSLVDYLKVARDKQNGESIAVIHRHLMKILLKSLRLLNIKRPNNTPYNQSSFIAYLKREHVELHDEMNLMFYKWCRQIFNNEDISDDIKGFITNKLCIQLGESINTPLSFFLNAPAAIDNNLEQKSDTYVHEKNGQNIHINVANVHSVKGETHTATLYLETFYYRYDIQRIIEYMKGNHIQPTQGTRHSLKLAYVGMTRPSHLLCVAAHKDGIADHLEGLAAVGWDIIRL